MTNPTEPHPTSVRSSEFENPTNSNHLNTTRRLFLGGVLTSAFVQSSAGVVTADTEDSSDQLGYGEGEYGIGGYGGVKIDDAFDLVLSIAGPDEVDLGQTETYDIRLENHGEDTPENVLIAFAVSREGEIDEGDIELEYKGSDDFWYTLPLSDDNGILFGTFGPDSGFPVPSGYDETTEIRAIFTVTDTFTADVNVVGVGEEENHYANATKIVSVHLPPSEGHCVDLLAGQHLDVGEVCISNNETDLTVVYTTNNGWELTETHLAVGTDLDEYEDEGWVNRAGNPRPGFFPYSVNHGPSDRVSYSIPLADLDGNSGDKFVIASHGVVQGDDNGRESAWGDGERFRARGNWAMYFEYEVE